MNILGCSLKVMSIIITKRSLTYPTIARHKCKSGNILIYLRYLWKFALHNAIRDRALDVPDNIMKMLIRIINTEVICLMGKHHQGICSKKNGYDYCEPEIIFRAYIESTS